MWYWKRLLRLLGEQWTKNINCILMLFVIPTRMDSKETPGWNSQYSCPYLDGREGTAPLLLNVHTALSFLIQLSTVYANNVVRITGQILLFSGESADSGPAFGNTNSWVLSAGYTVCVKLNQCFQGCWFRIVLLLHYGKNKNRIGHCESVCFTSWKWVVHLMFEKNNCRATSVRHGHTGAKTWASKESSPNWSKPKTNNSSTDKEHCELKGECCVFSLVFHNSDPF